MIQGYVVTLVCECHPRLVYHGLCYGSGITYETRTERELSGQANVNARYAELLESHGRYAFTVDKTGDFGSLHEAIEDEAARIARDDSTHPDKGFNVEKKDLKRAKKALAEYTPGASIEDQLDAAITDFTRNNADAWAPWAGPQSEQILREIARKEKLSITSAFYIARDAGLLATAV